MRRMFVWLFVTLLCMQVSSVFAQRIKQVEKSITKERKEQIKILKKEKGYSNVKVIAYNNSFWYYLVTKKDPILGKVIGILAPDEKILIPAQYQQIDYFEEIPEGKSPIARYNALLKETYPPYMLYHKESPAVFVASSSENIDFYATDGKLLNQVKGTSYNYLPGYFIIDAKRIDFLPSFESTFEIKNGKYMLQQNGSIMASNFESFEFRLNNDFCPYVQIQADGIKLKGVYFINNPTANIPPIFHNLDWKTDETGKLEWKVMRTASSIWETYDPLKDYSISYKDKGEYFFNKKMYEEVIVFYKEQKSTNPHAKYLTALSLFELAYNQISSIPFFYNDVVETKVYFTLPSAREKYEKKTFDLNLAKSMLQTCCNLLEAYLKEDSTYAEKARIRLKVANDYINETIPYYQEMYNTACAMIGEHNRQQNEKIANAFTRLITGVTESLTPKTPVSNTKQSVTSNFSNTNSHDNSSTSSTQSKELSAGVQDRIRQLERNIKNETTYLENAQKRYESNPTAVAKREIETHKRAIEGYKKQIEDLKNGR